MATLQYQPGQVQQLPVQPDSRRPPPNPAVVQAVAEVLASGLSPAGMVAAIGPSLAGVGIRAVVLVAVLRMVLHRATTSAEPGMGPALRSVLATEPTYRAAYLLASARRVQTAVDAGYTLDAALSAESRFLQAHYHAIDNRRQSAAAVDQAAQRWSGPSGLLGWKAVLDKRTSPECRAANGMNWPADRMPLLGFPGAVHPKCRCRPTRAFRNGRLLQTMGAVATI